MQRHQLMPRCLTAYYCLLQRRAQAPRASASYCLLQTMYAPAPRACRAAASHSAGDYAAWHALARLPASTMVCANHCLSVTCSHACTGQAAGACRRAHAYIYVHIRSSCGTLHHVLLRCAPFGSVPLWFMQPHMEAAGHCCFGVPRCRKVPLLYI
eukprot:366449-Chlamydomonas_euryale.AAC.18